jgi:hypothetical protein
MENGYMSNVATHDFWAGVQARRNGKPCPVEASEAFDWGYGMMFAAERADPPIVLEDVIPDDFKLEILDDWR